jgi:hypothetical protein
MANAASALQTMKILHRAFYLGVLLFAGVVTFMVASKSAKNVIGEFESTMQIIAVLLAVAAVFIGEKVFKNKLLIIKEENDLRVKIDLFRQASIVQWALLEGAAIFSVIGFYLSTNYAFLALAIFIVIYFILLTPNATKIHLLTGITAEELNSF